MGGIRPVRFGAPKLCILPFSQLRVTVAVRPNAGRLRLSRRSPKADMRKAWCPQDQKC